MKNDFLLLSFYLTLMAYSYAQPGALPSLDEYLRNSHLPTQTSPEGLHFMIERPGTGPSPVDGDYVLIHYEGRLLDSTLFDQSEPSDPLVFRVANREVIKGLDLGVQLLKKGGKARLFLPASLGYMQYGVEGSVPPDSPLMYEVELLDIFNFEQYDSYMRKLEERERLAFEQRNKAQFQDDLRLLEEYAAANQLKTKRTASGLSYSLVKSGKGQNARRGNHLKIEYEGYLTDGSLIERSSQPFEFVLGSARVIQGWEEGLQFFNQGSEGWLLIPSRLAYGAVNAKNIPANAALIFKIKVMEVR